MKELIWKKFPVLDDGFVCLVDVMGTDASVVQAARVSYGKDKRLQESHLCPECGFHGSWRTGVGFEHEKICGNCDRTWEPESSDLKEDLAASDRGLIRYLMRHRHTTPFEMAEIKILIRIPMDAWRQMIRHRTANVNEYSTRYSEAIDSNQTTNPDEWRLQAKSNKQGSSGFLEDWPKSIKPNGESAIPAGQYLTAEEVAFHKKAQDLYQKRLKFGIAREQARKDLPLSTYTESYWKIDLHNLFHFLSLRMHPHAQKEIRDYAKIIGEQIVKPLFPVCWEAFEDYRLGGMFLTRLDIEAIQVLNKIGKQLTRDDLSKGLQDLIPNKRESDECLAKLERMGIIG